jgi:predicted phosphoribosyltransferase
MAKKGGTTVKDAKAYVASYQRSAHVPTTNVPAARFRDRREAGKALAEVMGDRKETGSLVLGLPRGGVPVAAQLASEPGLDLDVFVVRKLGVPWAPELAMGAIAGGGAMHLNWDVIRGEGVTRQLLDAVVAHETHELERRERLYRGNRPPVSVAGRPAVLVDDGLATGASMRAAVAALKDLRPSRVTLALPVAPRETCAELRREVDGIVCALAPEPFIAVGFWYDDFAETSDEEVRSLLRAARQRRTVGIS